MAIFYARPVIAELEANDPREALNERNISALITFIEEVAHGVQAALLFQEGEREIDSEAYARNLEAQARIDTYLVLSKFVHVMCGGRVPRRVGSWLRRQLFDASHRRFATAPVARPLWRGAAMRARFSEAPAPRALGSPAGTAAGIPGSFLGRKKGVSPRTSLADSFFPEGKK